MKFLITNRQYLEQLCSKLFDKPTAIISITDYGSNLVNVKYKPKHLMRLIFDDVPIGKDFEEDFGREMSETEIEEMEIKFHSMSEGQVKDVVAFYNEVKDDVEVIICQCEHGQSRSAAIAAALTEFTYKNGIDIFADNRYCPNKSIFRKVLKGLREYEGK